MKYINEYGKKLQNNFRTKSKMCEDIENGIFDGTMLYECYIETIEEAVGWMLETYGNNAYDILVNDWVKNDKAVNLWGFDVYTLKGELEKAFDERRAVQYSTDILIRNEAENKINLEKLITEALEENGLYVLGVAFAEDMTSKYKEEVEQC